ncbi:YbaB/EbfC family nucleoid-associated protein [Amycolatopsis albispora]|uniref:YbaB/EbfC DNA-binding family protein n=1 Tax=Amycolatopsis albispora TaxID=1804986 RepID=A0A344L5L0_9PSEU|nr:YbaB/EbfC family nucleoid-associated protein [Amycolatopsis albispora]AXB43334.1 hypothetical protein A4R43_12870 [Amycolatopsis albispora]
MRSNPDLIEEMRWQLEKIQQRKAENERLLTGLGRADGEIGALRVTATSPNGTVAVVAGPGGTIQEITVREEALRMDAAGLSRLLTTTAKEAAARAARRQLEIVRAHAGPAVDPATALGPGAHLLTEPAPAPRPRATAEPEEPLGTVFDEGTAPAPVHHDEPVSDSDAFLRDLGFDR